jgi:hypothetical protein
VSKDGDYSRWQTELAALYPLALSEMRWPSHPLDTFETTALARWGLECRTGWRAILIRLLDKLEAAIREQPADLRDDFRIVQLKEKFGRLTVYQHRPGTPAMRAAIDEAGEASVSVAALVLDIVAQRVPQHLQTARVQSKCPGLAHPELGADSGEALVLVVMKLEDAAFEIRK